MLLEVIFCGRRNAPRPRRKKWLRPRKIVVLDFFKFIFRGGRNVLWESYVCSGNPLITECARRVVARCSFWDRSRNLGTGAVLILMVEVFLRRGLSKEVFYRELAQWSCTESSFRDLVQRALLRSCTAILPRVSYRILQRSCRQSSFRELVKRSLKESCQETSQRDLVQRSSSGDIVHKHRDLLQRSCQEASCINLAKRVLIERVYRGVIKSRDLARRLIVEIWCRDLVKRAECSEFFVENLNRDFIWRSLTGSSVEISYRCLVQLVLQRDLAQQLLQRTCQGDLVHDLLQRSTQREFAESNLVSLLPETALNDHQGFHY